jgi:hypothetical protein
MPRALRHHHGFQRWRGLRLAQSEGVEMVAGIAGMRVSASDAFYSLVICFIHILYKRSPVFCTFNK